MLENFNFFRVALAPTLWSAQNFKEIVFSIQLGTSEIRAGMWPATLENFKVKFKLNLKLENPKICKEPAGDFFHLSPKMK